LSLGTDTSTVVVGFSTGFSMDFLAGALRLLAESRLERVGAGRGVWEREGCLARSSKKPRSSFSFSVEAGSSVVGISVGALSESPRESSSDKTSSLSLGFAIRVGVLGRRCQ
jgi:hypothetical protein